MSPYSIQPEATSINWQKVVGGPFLKVQTLLHMHHIIPIIQPLNKLKCQISKLSQCADQLNCT